MIFKNPNILKLISFVSLLFISSCGLKSIGYNFTGGDVGTAETFQVNFFQNLAADKPNSTFSPNLDRDFTIALQDLITNQTNLGLVTSDGDLLYEGEIVEYRVSPMTATSNQTADENRLTMVVNVRFFNYTKEEVDFEKRFSFFYDYDANLNLDSVEDDAKAELFDRITQDIFNESLANW